jgi:hypothetical protein
MAASRQSMRHLRELLRLKSDVHLPQRVIAQACGIGLGTVTAYLQRARAAGLTLPVPPDLDDAALEARLFTGPASHVFSRSVNYLWTCERSSFGLQRSQVRILAHRNRIAHGEPEDA